MVACSKFSQRELQLRQVETTNGQAEAKKQILCKLSVGDIYWTGPFPMYAAV
jgi:hypothetical protein